MSNCEDAFQEQRLQQQKREIEDRLNRIRVSGYTVDGETAVPDNAVDAELRRQASQWDNQQFNDFIENALETKPRVNIGEGQPVNYRQLLANYDVQTASDYAKLAQLLTLSNKRLSPQDYAFVTEKLGQERIAQLVLDSYRDLNLDPNRVMALMANDAAAFNAIPERMIRLRVAREGYRDAYLAKLEEIAAALGEGNVSPQLKGEAFKAFKLALVSERHYSLAGRRTGQALYGRRGGIDSPGALDTDLAEQLDDGRLFEPDMAEVEREITMTPDDLAKDDHFSRVVEAIDDAKADPKKAAEKVKQLVLVTKLDGVDPKSRLGDKQWFNLQMKRGNALAKDSQLLNFVTQSKNVLSNGMMLFAGPYRQAFENIGTLTPYGTKFSREAMQEGFGVAWDSVKFGMDLTRASVRELFMDAFKEGKTPFGGNLDVYGRKMVDNEQLRAEIESLLNQPFVDRGSRGLLSVPENVGVLRNKVHAAFQLWRSSFGMPLTTGFRAMAGADNVSGYFFHVFKIKNDLEIRARRDGVQLGLTDQRSRDEWVASELDKAFYQLQPTEENIKSFRRENGLGTDVTDDEIAAQILEVKVGETYGFPTLDTPESKAAEEFSREMRFQNKPEEGLARFAYQGIQQARGHWLVDMTVPYVQAPFMGTLFDFRLASDWLSVPLQAVFGKNPTPQQVTRAKAAWVVSATLLALFADLDSKGLIIGNGPTEPKAREEWMTRLKAQGKSPNSIGDIPFLGGVPVLNTLFLWKDLWETFVTGTYSKYDQYSALGGVMQVLTGHLMRSTALGQVNQLLEFLLEPSNSPTRVIGYLGAGQIPGIGALRDIGRITGAESRNLFTTTAPGGKQAALGADDGLLEKTERFWRELAYGTLGITGMIDGAYRETDWLGSRINLPWGMQLIDALKDRFFPQVWPDADGKLYAELDAQDQLNPPRPLFSGDLDGVAMSDKLKKLYNDTYGSIRGEMSPTARLALAGTTPSVRFVLPYPIDLPNGITVNNDQTVSFPVAQFLEPHVKGKTVKEALRSLTSSPIYQAMQDDPRTTADLKRRDMPPAERRGQAAQVLLRAMKSYYELITKDALSVSSDPLATEWRDTRDQMRAGRSKQEADALRGFAEAMNGATMSTTP
jgi:hypothetical protein